MPKHLPALAARAAVVATLTTTAALAVVLPATTSAAAPAATPTSSAAAIPAAFLPPAPAVNRIAAAPVVERPVATVALAAPAARSAKISTAMNLALGKIGSPYRWGASGPNAFDCSGLVKWSFAQAGITLPRTSRAQSQVGTPVSKANLKPGDLVFFYSPVSHVAIYIGGGKVVHASTSGSPVKTANLSAMPFHSARRV